MLELPEAQIMKNIMKQKLSEMKIIFIWSVAVNNRKLIKLAFDIFHSLLWDCPLTQKKRRRIYEQINYTPLSLNSDVGD